MKKDILSQWIKIIIIQEQTKDMYPNFVKHDVHSGFFYQTNRYVHEKYIGVMHNIVLVEQLNY